MTSKIDAKVDYDDFPDQLIEIKSKLLDGSIRAISLDTNVFTRAGYKLDQGMFGRLDQFKDAPFQLVLSEVIIREVFKHISEHAIEKKLKFQSGLRGISKLWNIEDSKQLAVSTELLQEIEPKELAKKSLDQFINRCGVKLAMAEDFLNPSELLKHYFDTQPPFEGAKDKKAEFPDAIALLSLESWAKKEDIAVIIVTHDKGWVNYCARSERLFAINDIAKALTLIQEVDSHQTILCRKLEKEIAHNKHQNLLTEIEDSISDDIWSIDWIPEADAAYYYDAELESVELDNAEFVPDNDNPQLYPVDYRNGVLVARTTVSIYVTAACNFSFSVKDGVDRDMADVGSCIATVYKKVEIDILISFTDPAGNQPQIDNIELVPSRINIDFGSVGPEYFNDDPNNEYY